MAYGDGEKRGIGGWLMFFVITLGVVSPVVSLVAVYNGLYRDPRIPEMLGTLWPTMQAFDWGVAAISCAGLWFLTWRLVAVRTPASPRIVIAGLWLLGPALTIGSLVLGAGLVGVPVGVVFAGAGVQIMRPFVYAGIWTAYLLSSARVANTYNPIEDADALAEAFG